MENQTITYIPPPNLPLKTVKQQKETSASSFAEEICAKPNHEKRSSLFTLDDRMVIQVGLELQ